MLSDILPTIRVWCAARKIQPSDTVAMVGAGPIGLAALPAPRFYSRAEINMVDLDDNRLETPSASAPPQQ